MIDLVVRPLAGLFLCAAFGVLVLSLPTLIRNGRAWYAEIREGNIPAPVLSLIRPREEAQPDAERKAS
jgi:hypothetical protein